MDPRKEGVVFEALVYSALINLGQKNVHWNETPEGFPTDPDILIGNLEKPEAWLMITSSSSAKNTPEKFWRNAYELFSSKRYFNHSPAVTNIVFRGQQMEGMQTAFDGFCDTNIYVENFTEGQRLIDFVGNLPKSVPQGKEEKIEFLQKRISADKSIVKALKWLGNLINKSLRNHKLEMKPLWSLLQKETRQKRHRISRQTFLRRGLVKLMLFPPRCREEILQKKNGAVKLRKVPAFAFDLEIFGKTIGGATLIDEELQWLLDNFSDDFLKNLMEACYCGRKEHWDKWLLEIRTDSVQDNHRYVLHNLNELCTSQGMLNHLAKFSDAHNWLFWHLIEVFKTASGKRQGYGFAAISRDVGYSRGISQGYKYLADWANGSLRQELPRKLLQDVSVTFSRRLSDLGQEGLEAMKNSIRMEYRRNLFEQKLVAYWLFEPIPTMVHEVLAAQNISHERIQRHSTVFGEYVGTPNRITTPVIQVGTTIIHWKSAFKNSRDKVKELCGRATALRVKFETGRFQRRKTVEKLILVVDGVFTSDELSALYRSGWDEILYPDELSELNRAVI
jgi:hypothetical protein